jgi:phage-related protein
MSNIKPLNQVTFGEDLTIVVHDFINRHNNIKKINYTKPELEQQIATGCEQIANELINTEIERICEINRQIKQAKEILAKYGTELVRGY